MQCPSCNNQLLHAANFCPVCGMQLAGAQQHSPAPADSNVVYLHGQGSGELPPNPHAETYAAQPQVGVPQTAQPGVAGEGVPVPHAQPPHQVVPGAARQGAQPLPTPQQGEPVGDFWDDSPTAMIFDDDRGGEPRVIGSLIALGAIVLLALAMLIYALDLQRGAGGAAAGGFVLLSMLVWIGYLSLPREQQHAWLLRRHRSISDFLDRRVDPLRNRTETRMQLRRERDRYRAMRDERSRRVQELGETAYRQFRAGVADQALASGAQRVMAIEQQMLLQDHRLQQRMRDRDGEADSPSV